MDRPIKKKWWSAKRIVTIALTLLVMALITGSILFTRGNARNIAVDHITISEIKKGSFQEFTAVNGVVLPVTTIYLDAAEGGRVEAKYVEDGTMMTKGQPILKLSNTDIELNLVNQETQVYNLLTQMQIARNAAQQNTITKLNQMTDVESQLKEAERVYKVDKHMYEERVIGSQEFQQAENNYHYLLSKMKLTQQILQQDSVSTKQGVDQAQRQYQGSQSALEVMRKKVGDLIVRAPIDGQLTSLDAEVGQNKNKGERLGQIDILSGFKVRVDVDEFYIARIYTGLKGVFTFADSTYELSIKKVYTQVTNGRFQVDMAFTGKVPKGIRRGQTLQIRLALSDEKQALLLPRGGYYQQTAGNWIFKVAADGKSAYRTDIRLGGQNPDFYEVLQGLQVGDKVITSSYETYEKAGELVLK